jgi:hypothetical protein
MQNPRNSNVAQLQDIEMLSQSCRSLTSAYSLVDRDRRVHEDARFVVYARLLLFIFARRFFQIVDLRLLESAEKIQVYERGVYLGERRSDCCDEEAVAALRCVSQSASRIL